MSGYRKSIRRDVRAAFRKAWNEFTRKYEQDTLSIWNEADMNSEFRLLLKKHLNDRFYIHSNIKKTYLNDTNKSISYPWWHEVKMGGWGDLDIVVTDESDTCEINRVYAVVELKCPHCDYLTKPEFLNNIKKKITLLKSIKDKSRNHHEECYCALLILDQHYWNIKREIKKIVKTAGLDAHETNFDLYITYG